MLSIRNNFISLQIFSWHRNSSTSFPRLQELDWEWEFLWRFVQRIKISARRYVGKTFNRRFIIPGLQWERDDGEESLFEEAILPSIIKSRSLPGITVQPLQRQEREAVTGLLMIPSPSPQEKVSRTLLRTAIGTGFPLLCSHLKWEHSKGEESYSWSNRWQKIPGMKRIWKVRDSSWHNIKS